MKRRLYKKHPNIEGLYVSSKGIILRDTDKGIELVNQFGRGYKSMYRAISHKNTQYYVHTLVYQTWVQESWDKTEYELDHIDGNPSNNKLNNLRLLTIKENRQNVHLRYKPVKITNLKTGEVTYAKSGIHTAELLNTQRYYVSNALKQKKSILNETYKLEYACRTEAAEYFNQLEQIQLSN